MTTKDPTAPFFVGYFNKLPKALSGFLAVVMACLIGGFAGLAFAVAITQDDPGDARFRWDLGYQTMTGVIEAKPYPVLRLPPDADHPVGRTIMLSGNGKRGVQALAEEHDGKVVDAGGIILRRGDLDMLQVGGKVRIRPSETGLPAEHADFTPAPPVDHGRWRLSGEICDGKCYAGAMRPGTGLAHKACANVCLSGGVPAVFVSTSPVDDRTFFMMATADGSPLPASIHAQVAKMVRIDGAVERRGDLMVFKIDPETLEPLQ